jgi:predicted metal-dependent peptidase
MATLTVEERIKRQRYKVMSDVRFVAIAGILMVGTATVSDTIPTAATNGRDVIYGRKFVEGISDEVLRFTILHEAFHILLMHLTHHKPLFEQNAKIANMAADTVINLMLDATAGRGADGFIEVWEHACLDYQYKGMDTVEVFRRMMQQAQGQQQGRSKPGQGQPGQRAADGGEAQDFDQHDTEGDVTDSLTGEELKELAEQVDTAIRQGAQMAGRMGGSADRFVTDLLEVSVNWQEVLQDFVRTHAAGNDMATWRKLSRRWLARDIKQPTRYSEAAKCIVIGVDTSGSIGEEDLKRAMTEIKGACDTVHPEAVHVIYWDSAVAGHEVYEGESVASITDITKPKGGGGTRVGAMREFMETKDIKPDCVIVFTDGYVESDWGGDRWSAPVLWCVSTKGITAPYGKTLYVPVM